MTARAEELYEEIGDALKPILDGETAADAIAACGNAFWAVLHGAGCTPEQSAKIIMSYADFIIRKPVPNE